MFSFALTLSLTLGLVLTSGSHGLPQDLLKTDILDGSWDMTRYYYSDTANVADSEGSHCGKQEHIN